ncbi:hypothetical protein [Mycolicibacterium tusciae]|uniref:hypothetical protein n=1 Tax=Mycolicibacterium tusciae TaxID=75922 RepID=UPI00024A1322|nr:hypothetical protein [Mycolicibacterium tusciae]
MRRYSINDLREIVQKVADLRDELEAESSESYRLKAEEATLLAELKLSEAVLAAYTGNRAAPPVSEQLGQGALAGWKVLHVGAPGRLARTMTKAPG